MTSEYGTASLAACPHNRWAVLLLWRLREPESQNRRSYREPRRPKSGTELCNPLRSGGIATVKLKNLFGSWDLPCLLVLFNFLKLLTAKNTEEKLLYKYAVLKQLSEEKIFPFQDHGVVSEQLGFFVLFRRNVRKALTLDSRWPKPKLCFIRSSWGIPRRLIFVCFLFFRISVQARRLSPL